MPTPEAIVAGLLALAVLVGAVRLWHRRSSGPWWRVPLLIALAAISAVLLHLTLFPPRLPIGGETLVVATAQTPLQLRPGTGERLVALPEAPLLAAAERVPDLATALRRYSRVTRLRIEGAGLEVRDRPAAAGLPLAFCPLPLPTGLRRLEPPAVTATGAVFSVAGEVGGHPDGRVELIDPAGRRVDAVPIPADGRFILTATARTAGDALFAVRVRDARRLVVQDVPVVIHADIHRPTRLLLLGSPGPETKYLRRWASDAGLAVTTRLTAGGGVTLGDGSASLDAATLRATDVAVVDDSAWQASGGMRGPLARAAAGGLGVVVRITQAPSATMLRDARALGVTVAGAELSPLRLPAVAIDTDALAARRGPGVAEADPALNALDDPAPALARWRLRAGPGAVTAVADAEGAPLAAWSARGTGRVAIWAVPDSYALWLTGRRELYERWWSDVVTAVARPRADFAPTLPVLFSVGERAVICGVVAGALAIAPGGTRTPLVLPDKRVPGCAGYWPTAVGEHVIQSAAAGSAPRRTFYVHSRDAVPAARAQQRREATLRLVATGAAPRPAAGAAADRGPAWPWLLAWLLVSGGLWWLERRRDAGPEILNAGIRQPAVARRRASPFRRHRPA